jgi:hypothetical protein
MTMESILYPKKVALGAGIVGGIAGGAVMYGVMSIVMTQIGMGANCFAIIMGLITGESYENALGPGITAHFLTSIAIGVAFGAIITTKKFQIRGFGKGVGLGVATGVIVYVVIFLPIAMTAIPPHMMDLMKMMPMGNMEGNMQSNSMNEQSSMQGNSMSQGQMSNTSEMNQKGTMAGNTMQGKGAMDEKMKMEQMDKMITEETQKMFPLILAGSLVSHIAFGAALGAVVTPIVKKVTQRSGR